MVKKKVLIIDEETQTVEVLKYTLEKAGYLVKTCRQSLKSVEIALSFFPAMIILDLSMPGQDGIETCLKLRGEEALQDTYIMFLTARQEEYVEIAAFENGADGYLSKPVKPRALVSRVNAILERRSMTLSKESRVVSGNLVIDKAAYTVELKGKNIMLSKKEFDLLYFLASHPKKVFSREYLIATLWGEFVYILPRTIDVHVRKIREKVGEGVLQTIKGVGYKFDYQMNEEFLV